jgi:hypothetical protein
LAEDPSTCPTKRRPAARALASAGRPSERPRERHQSLPLEMQLVLNVSEALQPVRRPRSGITENPLFGHHGAHEGGSNPALNTIFAEIDVDGSGQLSIEEFSAWWTQVGGDASQATLFREGFTTFGVHEGVSLQEFKVVIAAVAANDWLEKNHPTRGSYWWNQRTGESSWTDPGGKENEEQCVQEWLQRVGPRSGATEPQADFEVETV